MRMDNQSNLLGINPGLPGLIFHLTGWTMLSFFLIDMLITRYMPIIPVVLANGSEGIGTGWSSYIPNYNPKDIVANVRRLLNNEPMQPMDPWYRGFTKSATKEAGVTYTVTGAIEEVNDTTLKITELPVRRWTQDYKEFLESMMTGNDKSKEPFIKKALLDNLELQLLKLDNQVRFILGVVSGEIIVNNRKRADLFLELQQKGFTPMPKKTKGIDAAAAEATEDEEEDEQKEESPEAGKRGVKASDYEYLMSMPIGSLTLEKVQELCAEKDKLDGEVDELRRTSPRSLWLKELDALEEELDVSITATSEFVSLKLERKDAEAEEMRIKNNAGAGPSRQAPKKPRKNASNSSSVIGSEKTVTEAVQKKTKGGSKRAPPAKKVDLFFTSLMLRSLLLESLLHLTQGFDFELLEYDD
ncbi:hypothetical protein B296_00002008 [Ensete ventricosum]|uniref:DNA topoisomerase (ATP-hydrolyzing) n=1 Tax=Ensete ventricosum TaxID=4639 RepID=A0A427BAB3_ENSVE|nr:hypothetical protein B296_00002008 [Ensete ventricosum]